jgi:sec-independent protein translocase protein TatA
VSFDMIHPLLGIGGLGVWELVVILVIVLVIFGVGKLPEIGSGLGKGIRNFRKSIRGEEEEENKDDKPSSQINPPKN